MGLENDMLDIKKINSVLGKNVIDNNNNITDHTNDESDNECISHEIYKKNNIEQYNDEYQMSDRCCDNLHYTMLPIQTRLLDNNNNINQKDDSIHLSPIKKKLSEYQLLYNKIKKDDKKIDDTIDLLKRRSISSIISKRDITTVITNDTIIDLNGEYNEKINNKNNLNIDISSENDYMRKIPNINKNNLNIDISSENNKMQKIQKKK